PSPDIDKPFLKLVGRDHVVPVQPRDFNLTQWEIVGLGNEQFLNETFCRAFASRIIGGPPRHRQNDDIKSLLLWGPWGCGKTNMAIQLAKALHAQYSQNCSRGHNIDEIFSEAEEEQLETGDESRLHIVLINEIEDTCRNHVSTPLAKFGTWSESEDSILCQLLHKAEVLNNILLIGTTSREDLLVDNNSSELSQLKLLVNVGLPDVKVRLEILNHRTRRLHDSNCISQENMEQLPELAEQTQYFSGCELEGLVKAATTYALSRCGGGILQSLSLKDSRDVMKFSPIVNYSDFEQALQEITPRNLP
ncbi:hypothetical protein ACHAWF_000755, partial [Thalassiosira exigua]